MLGKQKKWQALADDPQLPFMVGRLIGANEMAVAMLSKEQNDTAQRVASVLASATMFFMEDGVPQAKVARELPASAHADALDTEIKPVYPPAPVEPERGRRGGS